LLTSLTTARSQNMAHFAQPGPAQTFHN
jgi:hypothetical protein